MGSSKFVESVKLMKEEEEGRFDRYLHKVIYFKVICVFGGGEWKIMKFVCKGNLKLDILFWFCSPNLNQNFNPNYKINIWVKKK